MRASGPFLLCPVVCRLGNLCIGVETFPDYHARRMIDLLLAGLAQGTAVNEAASER
jgi:hypothetical protein